MIPGVPRKHWLIPPDDPRAAELQDALGCSRLCAQLLVRRGITDQSSADAFLSPSFDQLADPMLLPDAAAAVARLRRALSRHERIYVHGDYDGDGVTAAALWTRLLRKLGGDVLVHVPHRRRDGYDMRSKFVEIAREAGAQLILTADCGIQRHQEVDEAAAAGIDVIVTDHHEVLDTWPRAVAVVDPHRPDCRYPFHDLAAVGVAFRLGEALVRDLGHSVGSYRDAYADLAAIGTITDIMPLLGDNRVFVRHGLRILASTRKLGLRALMESSGLDRSKGVNSHQVGFVIGPRLNAVGRMDEPSKALDLLLSVDDGEAASLSADLESANLARRSEETRIMESAVRQIEDRDLRSGHCLVVASSEWHPGVIGVVASRLVERYGLPAVLMAIDEDTGTARGSGRSIPAFDLHTALGDCSEHLTEFGGHTFAAGFSIRGDAIPDFVAAFRLVAGERLSCVDLRPSLTADAAMSPADLSPAIMEELERFEPWGHANGEPLLVGMGLDVRDVRRIGRGGGHLKLRVSNGRSGPIDALMWNSGDLADHIPCGSRIDLCYRPQINTYGGREALQLRIEDLRLSET